MIARLRGILAARLWGVGANLAGADLSRASLENANLHAADLSNADLQYAWLIGARLSQAKADGANLTGARMGGARLSGADLRGAHLARADLRHAIAEGWTDRGEDRLLSLLRLSREIGTNHWAERLRAGRSMWRLVISTAAIDRLYPGDPRLMVALAGDDSLNVQYWEAEERPREEWGGCEEEVASVLTPLLDRLWAAGRGRSRSPGN
jgi:hypothetical protein